MTKCVQQMYELIKCENFEYNIELRHFLLLQIPSLTTKEDAACMVEWLIPGF